MASEHIDLPIGFRPGKATIRKLKAENARLRKVVDAADALIGDWSVRWKVMPIGERYQSYLSARRAAQRDFDKGAPDGE